MNQKQTTTLLAWIVLFLVGCSSSPLGETWNDSTDEELGNENNGEELFPHRPELSTDALYPEEAAILEAFGFDPGNAFVSSDKVAYADMYFHRSELRTLADKTVSKGYAAPGFPVADVTKICVATFGLPTQWHWAIKRAAHYWSNEIISLDSSLIIDPFFKRTGTNILVTNTSTCPVGSWVVSTSMVPPGTCPSGGIACASLPGGGTPATLQISTGIADGVTYFNVALMAHELGHTIGLRHPDQAAINPAIVQVPNTATWPYPSVMGSLLRGDFPVKPFSDDVVTADALDLMGTAIPYCGNLYSPVAALEAECSADCPCELGVGDCDSGQGQCKHGLECGTNNGLRYSLPNSSYDACVKPSTCPVFVPGGSPDVNFCNNPDCPCGVGEGDCEPKLGNASDLVDGSCGGFLECGEDIGAAAGLPSHYDACRFPPDPGCEVDPEDDTSNQCGNLPDGCKCRLGEGDCNGSGQCRGDLVCASNVGALFGRNPNVDICVRPDTPGITVL